MNFISLDNAKKMSNGMRMLGNSPLSPEEIAFVKNEIRLIEADESIFIFNSNKHTKTCYIAKHDRIYIGRNIFPETKYGSTHPRDLMSVYSGQK